jgi:hypothetical protein
MADDSGGSVEICLYTANFSDAPQNMRVYDYFPTSHQKFKRKRAETFDCQLRFGMLYESLSI